VAILIGFRRDSAVIGWCYRNMFAHVFLTLGMLGVAALTILIGGQVAAIGVVTGAAGFCVPDAALLPASDQGGDA
jgi:hypothetical protein